MARTEIDAALALKSNYTQALLLLAQLEINEGNTELAIATTRNIIQLEPNNPTRYLQLGVLLTANENFVEAVAAYREALMIDPYHANARYLLALIYLNNDQTEVALQELKLVQSTNQDNVELKDLIGQIEAGEFSSSQNLDIDIPVQQKVIILVL